MTQAEFEAAFKRLAPRKAATIEDAEAAGRDYAKNGANTTNCHFRIFGAPELTKAWERGRDAVQSPQGAAMSDLSKCNQAACENPPAFRFTWPGKDEAAICLVDALKLQGVAAAIGLHVQMIPLTVEDYLGAPR